MTSLIWLCAIPYIASATPSINLPINAQVPPVARVDQPFQFTFSSSTFTTSAAAAITYTLSNAPSWLALDGLNRTFSGTPQLDDAGSLVVNLNAADDTGSVTMPVTLVVSAEQGPAIGLLLADQLPAYGAFSAPESILLTPASPLLISFSASTFSDTDEDTMYYAISDNNTPLPSWLHFDPANLSFSGMAPQVALPADESQSFRIRLTASNVAGFSDATLAFTIVIEEHLLFFQENVQIFNITPGINIPNLTLINALITNGHQATPSDVTEAWSTSIPSWLSLDSHTLVISGTPPADFRGQNFSVTVSDTFGDSATTMVVLQSARASAVLFLNPIGVANATIGSDFVYPLGPVINATGNLNIDVAFGIASAWLEFDHLTQSIKGHVPNDLMPQQVVVNITARQGLQSESEILTIAVQGADESVNSSTNPSAPADSTESTSAHPHMRRRWIAAAVLAPLFLILGLGLLFLYWWRRRRGKLRRSYMDSSPSLSDEKISGPITLEKNNPGSKSLALAKTFGGKRNSSRISAPKLDLNLNWSLADSRRRSSKRYSNLLEFNSIAEQRALNRADPEISRTMEAKDQVARRILKQQPIRSKRCSQERRAFPALTGGRNILGENQMRSGFGHGKPEPGSSNNTTLFRPPNLGFPEDNLRQGRLGLGPVRRSWKNWRDSRSDLWTETSSSITKDSDSAREHPALRHTIRPVGSFTSNNRRDRTSLPRPLSNMPDEYSPRLSRLESPPLSPSQQEPLRVPKRKRYQLDLPTRVISVKQGMPRTNDSRSQSNQFVKGKSTYREEAKRLHQAREFSTSLKRPPATLQRTSRDPRDESTVPSEASVYDDDTLDNLSNSAGHSWLPSLGNPLRANPVEVEDVRAGLTAAEAAESKSRGPLRELAHRLSRPTFRSGVPGEVETKEEEVSDQPRRVANSEGESDVLGDDVTMRTQSESSVRAGMTRGQRLGQMVKGLQRDASGNRSMHGEIKRSTSSSFV